jgi:hypothetical protein
LPSTATSGASSNPSMTIGSAVRDSRTSTERC